MIDATFFRRFYVASAITGIILAAGAFLIWGTMEVTLGTLAGLILGIVPFASWNLVFTLFKPPTNRFRQILGVLITIAKYGILGAGFYALLKNNLINHFAVFAGIISVTAVLVILGAKRPISIREGAA